jgi:hypothetical protein
MKYPVFASDETPGANYVRTVLAEVRWFITKEGKAELQQLYEDGWGKLHWVTVPSIKEV